jgi:hypothetical protein
VIFKPVYFAESRSGIEFNKVFQVRVLVVEKKYSSKGVAATGTQKLLFSRTSPAYS